jgi:mannose-6-phosphate isomerase-like protein (cupin superfamily)
VIAGEIDLELDGSIIHLTAGAVMVQRGTIHDWVNRGPAPCVLASWSTPGRPRSKVLPAVG